MMCSLPKMLRRACGGNIAIEFALVAPLFFGLVFGAVEYGRLLWTWQALQETAAAGARCMAIPQSSCASGGSYNATNTKTFIQDVAQGWGLSIASGNISLYSNTTCGGSTNFSEVSVSTTFYTVVPKIVLLPAGGKTLSASACFPNPT